MFMAVVRVAICALRRVDTSLPQAYGRSTVQVHTVFAHVCTLRSPDTPLKTTRVIRDYTPQMLKTRVLPDE